MSDKTEQALYWPHSMLREIQTHAWRTDRSLSYIVQHAWLVAVGEIGTLDGDKMRVLLRPYALSEKRKQSLFLTDNMINDMHALSKKLETSVSTLIHTAYVLAKPALDMLPTVNVGMPQGVED